MPCLNDFDEFERLVEAAAAIEGSTHLIVLLGGEAGLRCGEIMALEWDDVDLKRRPAHVVVRRSEWRGHVTEPEGGRSRRIPLTGRLSRALKVHGHLTEGRAGPERIAAPPRDVRRTSRCPWQAPVHSSVQFPD